MTRYDHLAPVAGPTVDEPNRVPLDGDPVDRDPQTPAGRGDSLSPGGEPGEPMTDHDHLAQLRQRASTLLRGAPREWGFWAFIIAIGAIALVTLVALITGLYNAVNRVDLDAPWVTHMPDWAITSTITNPVSNFLASYAQGLPLTANNIGWLWLLSTVAFFVLATVGAFGARVGWILSGVLTTAAVVAGSPLHNAAVAGGVTVLVWALLSLIALRRLPDDGPKVVVVPPKPASAPAPWHDEDEPLDDRDSASV